MPNFKDKENILLVLTLVLVVLSVVTSIFVRPFHLDLKTIYAISMPGVVLMNLLKMILLPLVVFSILSGLTSINLWTSGKLGMYTFFYYLTTTFVAVMLGMLVVSLISPGKNSKNIEVEEFIFRKVDAIESIFNLVNNLFPENIIRSTFQLFGITFKNVTLTKRLENETERYTIKQAVYYSDIPNYLGIIFITIFVGIVLNSMGVKGQLLVYLINVINDLVMKMVIVIICFMPFGVYFLLLSTLLKIKDILDTFKSLGMLVVTVLVGLLVHMNIILPSIFYVVLKRNPYQFMWGMSKAMLVAFLTQSSSATIPVTLHCVEEINHVDPRITKFMIPIGAVVNMDGTGVYEAVCAIFIAQLNKHIVSFVDLIKISLTATLAAVGAASVPSAGIVTLMIVLASVGLPTHQIGLLYALDWILDRCRTAVNVLGDGFGTAIVEHYCLADLETFENLEESPLDQDQAFAQIVP